MSSDDAIPLASSSSVVNLDQLASNGPQTIYFTVRNKTGEYVDLRFEDKKTSYELAGKRRDGIRVTLSDLSTMFTAAGEGRYECKGATLGQLIGEKQLLVGRLNVIK